MSKIILPDVVQQNRSIEAQLEKVSAIRQKGSWLKEFDFQLKELDPKLSLVKAGEHSDLPELMPGYWHVKRSNDGAPDSFLPIATIDGHFKEPDSGTLEWLRRNDLQRPGALHEIYKRQEEEMRAHARKQAQIRTERKDEFYERYRSHANASVSMKKNWKNKAKGRNG